MKIDHQRSAANPILIEDESRMIGRRALPATLFDRIRREPAIVIEEKLEARVNVIFEEYALQSENKDALGEIVRASIQAITKKLGGVNTTEILKMLSEAENIYRSGKGLEGHRRWMERLLICYYDPLYTSSLQRRQSKIAFRGSRVDCMAYIRAAVRTVPNIKAGSTD